MTDPFHVRFNIEIPIDEARRRFINRIENTALKIASALLSGRRSQDFPLNPLMREIKTVLGEPHNVFITGGIKFIEVWRHLVHGDFSLCLQTVEAFFRALDVECGPAYSDALNQAVTEIVSQAEIDLGIFWQNGFFSKKGAELLDEKLVNEPLRWLADPKYDNVLIPFKKGLSHLLEGTKDSQRFGDAVTDMYEALEAMAKIITGKPNEELSTLREQFVSKLRLSDSHRAMLKEYISYGGDFRHAVKTGKQRSWPLEHEAENFVYLTGLFLRLAIQAEKL